MNPMGWRSPAMALGRAGRLEETGGGEANGWVTLGRAGRLADQQPLGGGTLLAFGRAGRFGFVVQSLTHIASRHARESCFPTSSLCPSLRHRAPNALAVHRTRDVWE